MSLLVPLDALPLMAALGLRLDPILAKATTTLNTALSG
jgi:hypothetical protein